MIEFKAIKIVSDENDFVETIKKFATRVFNMRYGSASSVYLWEFISGDEKFYYVPLYGYYKLDEIVVDEVLTLVSENPSEFGFPIIADSKKAYMLNEHYHTYPQAFLQEGRYVDRFTGDPHKLRIMKRNTIVIDDYGLPGVETENVLFSVNLRHGKQDAIVPSDSFMRMRFEPL